MSSPNLLIICGSAFAAVFILLSALALLMHLIILVFPERSKSTNKAVIAAVATTIQNVYPGTRITKIEEVK